jgi:hypothetical protein
VVEKKPSWSIILSFTGIFIFINEYRITKTQQHKHRNIGKMENGTPEHRSGLC